MPCGIPARQDALVTDTDTIAEAVYAAVAGVVLRGRGVNPPEIVAALERAQDSLEQVKAYWLNRARDYVAKTNLRSLRTELIHIALTGLEREIVDGLHAFKVHKNTEA